VSEHDRDTLCVGRKARIVAEVDHRDVVAQPAGDSLDRFQTIVTQGAVGLRDEAERTHQPAAEPNTDTTNVADVRPTTAAVMIGLLLLILVAFVIKAQTSGFTP